MSMKGQPMNLTMKSVSALLLVGSLSACGGGGTLTNTETGETSQCKISQGFVECAGEKISTNDIQITEQNGNTYKILYMGQEYTFEYVDEVPDEREGILGEEQLNMDLNGDGDKIDTVIYNDSTEKFDFKDYDLADTAAWNSWNLGTEQTGQTVVTNGEWSSWTVAPAEFWVANTTRTRSRTVTTTIGATTRVDNRTCEVTVNGQTDNPAPTCNGEASRTVTTADGTSSTSTETETEMFSNPEYQLTEGTADTSDTTKNYVYNLFSNLNEENNLGLTESELQTATTNWYNNVLGVNGLQEAHANGWTGKGESISIVDNGNHGLTVKSIAGYVAPGAYLNSIQVTANNGGIQAFHNPPNTCLLYTSPSPRDRTRSRMPSSA